MPAFALIPIVLVLAAPTGQEIASAAHVVSDSSGQAPDPVAIVRELAARTNRLEAFTATYEGVAKGFPITFTLAYRAPGLARFEGHSGSEPLVRSWFRDGRMFIHGPGEEGPSFADVDTTEVLRAAELLFRAVEALLPGSFPTPMEGADLGPGPMFVLGVSVVEEQPKLQVEMRWSSSRKALLAWLDEADAWHEARVEGETLVRQGSAGLREILSTRTGFLQELVRGEESRLRLVSFRTEAPVEELEVPPRPIGATDRSAESTNEMKGPILLLLREHVYAWAASHREAGSPDADGRRELLRGAFEVFHEPILKERYQRWMEQQTDWLERRFADARNHLRANPDDLDDVLQELAAARKQYRERLDSTADRLTQKLVPCAEWDLPEAAQLEILPLEREVQRTVFQREVIDVLLARFDELERDLEEG